MTRILIVENERDTRANFSRHLKEKGYEVDSVKDFDAALSLLGKDTEIAVVVLGLSLDNDSGLKDLEIVKQTSPLSKIIIITEEPSAATISAAIRAGAVDCLFKPVKPEDLAVIVGNAAGIRALEIENARYRERLENLVLDRTRQICEFNERLQHIAEETKNFSVCESPQILAERILGLLSANMDAGGGSLFWREKDHLRLVAALDSGHQRETIPLPPPPDSVIGKVFDSREGFVVSDIEAGGELRPSGWNGYNNGSFMALPYQDAGGEVLGVLALHDKREPPFTQQDLKIGRIIASHSLEALKNIQLKRSLAESETKYRQISEESITGIFIHSNGKIIYSNPKLGAMLGFTKDELPSLYGKPFINYVHPQDRALVGARAQKRLENEHPVDHYEFRLLKKNGRTLWVEILVSRIEHEGSPALMGNFIDITPRKKAEEEIAERNRDLTILNRFITASNEAASSTDLMAFVLRGVLEWLDFEGGGIYLLDEGEDHAALKFHLGLSDEFIENIQRVPVDKTPFSIVFKKGRPFFVENNSRKLQNQANLWDYHAMASIPIFSSDRVIGALNIVSRNVFSFSDSVKSLLTTIGKEVGNSISRLQTEEALRKSERRLREITDNMSDLVSKCDLNGVLDYLSPSHQSALEVNPDNLLGTSLLNRIHPEDRDAVSKLMETVTSEKKTRRTQYRFLCDDDSYKWLESIGKALVDDSGRARGMIISSRDVTDKKKAEEEKEKLENQLRQSQKMEAVGRLAGGIAHDFNNILTGIGGYAEMILDSLAKEDPLYSEVSEIEKAAQRASKLTQQLLGFSRKQVISPIVANLNDLIESSRKMLARIIEEDVELEYVPGEDLNNVKVDPHQLDQILVNLAVNARDAMPGGGALVIETKNVTLDRDYTRKYPWIVPGNYVMLAVSDTGVGIPQESLKHIFEPFYTTKDKGKGTGLGLSTVYGIVKQNNGFINVYSEEGIGSTFKIYLPRIEKEVEAQVLRSKEATLSGHETVVVVEDEQMVRTLAARVLGMQGYQVRDFEQGVDAVEFCNNFEGDIHLLLTDVIMPGMTGKEVYDRVNLKRPNTKVLYMSGYTENVIAHHGVLHDGMNFIQKPFSVENLVKKVREILDA